VANLSEWSCNVKNKDLTPSDPIQEYLVSAIQNIETLIRCAINPTKGVRSAPLAMLGWRRLGRLAPMA
jgi:hypothetical protein